MLVKKYKILPRKTFDSEFKFDFNLVPKALLHHFIRGYFDADGSISFYKGKVGMFFNFSFVFNSETFTNQIANIFQNLFEIKPVVYKKTGKTANWLALRFHYSYNRVRKVKEIYKWLYNNSNVFLSRKKTKFEQYFEYRANCTIKSRSVV